MRGNRLLGGLLAAARTVGWNVLLLLAGLALIAAGGEAWLRLTKPFMHPVEARRFVPGVGFTRTPGAEVRWTNGRDIWTVSRANSLGFLDREPPPPGKAAQSCHVTVIGDSFVDAREVAVPDKLQVRLEALAAGELPELEVTTSAFGMTDTGQIEQLPFYDAFARRLRSKLVVLVFVHNDWHDNNRTSSLRFSAEATGTGSFKLAPPAPDRDAPIVAGGEGELRRFLLHFITRASWFARSQYQTWMHHRWPKPELPPDVAATDFALDQFEKRTDRDGAALAILAAHTLKSIGRDLFRSLRAMAAARGIPIIDQHEHIVSRNGRMEDAHFPADRHWSPAGHQWAAEALLEHLKRNRNVCAN